MLKVGDPAPKCNAIDQNGEPIMLGQFAGKRLILYFYPKDDTPGCTAEACDLRDNHSDLLNQGFAVVGVSRDKEKSHRKFIEKFRLPFPLISDLDGSVCEAFGVWGKKKFMGREYMGILRTTFIISPDGMIEAVIDKVDTKESSKQILAAL